MKRFSLFLDSAYNVVRYTAGVPHKKQYDLKYLRVIQSRDVLDQKVRAVCATIRQQFPKELVRYKEILFYAEPRYLKEIPRKEFDGIKGKLADAIQKQLGSLDFDAQSYILSEIERILEVSTDMRVSSDFQQIGLGGGMIF